ncbi:hypothetical protein C8034_v005507 [Colletotrichum sidae]|uniref:Uncharacterized protein n=1 Tax=Colletotrichum sidae TaxID=1347389 RepID=A0A4R8T6W6_9PEZI|nr:hypothetical protein C8034_v005507 [Colletotrichum sidae]
MSSNIPSATRTAEWRSTAGVLDKKLKLNANTNVPKTAASLSKNQTLVKVAFASVNHLDYKLAETPLGSVSFGAPAIPGRLIITRHIGL